jgi:hypothetical protein
MIVAGRRRRPRAAAETVDDFGVEDLESSSQSTAICRLIFSPLPAAGTAATHPQLQYVDGWL